MFPGVGIREPTDDQFAERSASWTAGPAGVVVDLPRDGAEPMSARQLPTELVSNMPCCACIAFVLLHVVGCAGYGRRVLLATAFGACATLEVDVSNWNGWGAPTDCVLGQALMAVAGAFLAGLCLARPVRASGRATA